MKIIITMCIAIFSFISISFAISNINFEPVKLNYYTINKFGNNFVITANKGYILEYDVGNNKLYKYKVFDKPAKIIKLIYSNNKYYAFNEIGQMAISNSLKQKWDIVNIKDMKLLSVIIWNNKFVMRTDQEIIIVDNLGKITAHYKLVSPVLKRFSELYTPTYLNSITNYNDRLYVETDSNKILIFSNELKLIDSIEIAKSAAIKAYDSLKYYGSHYRLIKTESVLYAQIYWVTKKYSGYSILVKIDKNNIVLVDTIVNSTFFFPKVINDTMFQFTFDKSFVDTNKFTFSDKIGTVNFKIFNYTNYYYRLFNDYYVFNNTLFIVGLGGILQKFNLDDKSVELLNEQYWIDENLHPIVMDNNKLIFLSGSNSKSSGSKLDLFFYSTNDLLRFNSTMEININPDFKDLYKSFYEASFYNIEYDKVEKHFKLLGKLSQSDYIFNSSDSLTYPTIALFILSENLDTLKYNLLEKPFSPGNDYPKTLFGNLNLYDKTYYFRANVDFSNRKINNFNDFKYYVNYFSYNPVTQKDYTSFTILNSEYYPVDRYLDSTYVMDFVFLKSLDNFLVHCANTIDSGRSEIKFTENHGLTWNYLYKYAINDTLLGKYHIKLNNNEYLLLFHYDGEYSNTKMYFDAVDLSSYTWKRLRQWDLTKENKYFTQIGIFSDGNELNFAIGDTLYYIKDLYNIQSWKYRVLADSGRMFDPITKYDDKFISGFANQYGNYGLCLISFSDTTLLGVEDYEIEKRNYLYLMSPYPIPATNQVQAEIYWDKALEINQAVIKVYNIYGEEIDSEDKIEVIPESDWYGKIIWKCDGIDAGVYIITVNYGTEKKAIKVIKN